MMVINIWEIRREELKELLAYYKAVLAVGTCVVSILGEETWVVEGRVLSWARVLGRKQTLSFVP